VGKYKGEMVIMLNERICELRERLNECIITGKKYEDIYSISVELDELIAKYYKMQQKKKIVKKNQ